jgi:YVTN family beta-propeller protein
MKAVLVRAGGAALLAAAILVPTAARAATLTATLTSIQGANAVAVNPVTNKVYVGQAAYASGSGVTVIDGATNAKTTIATGESAGFIAVNPVTNKIYVANGNPVLNGPPGGGFGTDVTVIDGATNAMTPVTVGANPCGVAVNPATNKIYVAASDANQVTVIDGATNATSSIPVGTNPCAVAVNPVTNKVYVANRSGSGSVTIIDGAGGTVLATVPTGQLPSAIAVNPSTNVVYVAAYTGGNVTVIDGGTDAVVTTVTAGISPVAIVANPATNKIYVANYGFEPGATCCTQPTGDVTVIDGGTNGTTSVGSGTIRNPAAFALNTVTNTVYVMQGPRWNGVGVIDGGSNGVGFGPGPNAAGGIAVNPVTNTLYGTEPVNGKVYVVDENGYSSIDVATVAQPLAATVNPVTGKVYICGTSLGILDGATNASTSVPIACVGRVGVNPATNTAYVSDGSGHLYVVSGSTDSVVATIPLLANMNAVAVNEITNRIYVICNFFFGNIVTVVDGNTNTVVTTVSAGPGPIDIDIDRGANKVYVANSLGGSISVIDGATNVVTSIDNGGRNPSRIVVNPVSHKIYASNFQDNSVSVIDGATNALAVVPVGAAPVSLAVNPVTNMIYTANQNDNTATIINGATNTTSNVPIINHPVGIGVDSVNNKVYVASLVAGVSVIDGASDVSTVPTAAQPSGDVTVNPVNGKAYATENGSASVAVITNANATLANHAVTLAGGAISPNDAPALTFNVGSTSGPHAPATLATYYNVNDAKGIFSAATGSASTFVSPPAPLRAGTNFVKAFALDAQGDGSYPSIGTTLIGAPAVLPLVSVAPVFTGSATLAGGLVGLAYSQSVSAVGGSGPLTYTLAGGTLPPGLALAPDGTISGTPTADGFYTFTLSASDGAGSGTRSYGLTVMASNPARQVGISTRMQVLTGDNVVIGGFAIGGAGGTLKRVVIRARGPSLAAGGVANPMANPVLQLYSGSTLIASNDDWKSAPNAADIEASGFAPAYESESAIMVTLDSGLYTAVVSGANNTTGVGIVEVFEVDHAEVPLVAISTRGFVQTGDNVMIGGFVISGNTPQTVVVRARGPSLAANGVPNPLQDPSLTLVGSGISITNDNWGSAPNAAQIQASGFAPADARESAILVTLQPGAYTAIVSGAGGATGVGIVEVFAQ